MTRTSDSPQATAGNGRSSLLMLIVFAVGFAAALLMVTVGWRSQRFVQETTDPYFYGAMAKSLLKGEGFSGWGSVLNRRGPLYPAFIALVYLVTGERVAAMQVVQSILQGGVCVLAYDMGRRVYNVRTGLIAGLICGLHPALLRYVPDFHVETFLTFLSALGIWAGVVFQQRPNVKTGAFFGLSCALGALTKPVLLLFPVAFVAYWLFLDIQGMGRVERAAAGDERRPLGLQWRFPGRSSLAAAGAVALAMSVVILPWTYRNYRSSGHFVLVTTGFGDAFLRGYIFSKRDFALLRLPPYTYAENESNALIRKICAEADIEWQKDDIETERVLSAAAKKQFYADPADFGRKFVVQLLTFWYEMTSLLNSLVAGVAALVLWVFALIGWPRARQEGRASWPLYLPILCLNVSLAILLALGRYSVPILPALAVLAAFGVDTVLARRAAARGAAHAQSAQLASST